MAKYGRPSKWFAFHWSDNCRAFTGGRELRPEEVGFQAMPFISVRANSKQNAEEKLRKRIDKLFPDEGREIGVNERRMSCSARPTWFDVLKIDDEKDIRIGNFSPKTALVMPKRPFYAKF